MSTTISSCDRSRFAPALAASAILVLVGGCHGADKPPCAPVPGSKTVAVTLGQCPIERESGVGKIYGEAELLKHPTATLKATIVLRTLSQTVRPCPGDTSSDARCTERDQSLTERASLNAQEWACVVQDIVGEGRLPPETIAVWYEVPYHLTSGRPVPIATMVQLPMTLDQVERVAQHPYVERIEPPVDKAWAWNAGAPAPPGDCPKPTDEPIAKLTRLTSIQGLGRQPVVIELKHDGVLPPLVPCTNGTDCSQSDDALWDRTIMSVRELTCVRRWIDAQVTSVPAPVDYTLVTGSLSAAELPPFGQPTVAVKAFGLELTWDESMGIAKHPFVETLWTTPGLAIASAGSGCPPDFSVPVAPVECTSDRESPDGKLSSAARNALEGTSGPQQVVIRVRGGATICTLPECPGPPSPCPERDMYTALWQAQNAESQHCVRALITEVGGTSEPTVEWLVNFISATLTWDQIQVIASHPHVLSIEPAVGGGLTSL